MTIHIQITLIVLHLPRIQTLTLINLVRHNFRPDVGQEPPLLRAAPISGKQPFPNRRRSVHRCEPHAIERALRRLLALERTRTLNGSADRSLLHYPTLAFAEINGLLSRTATVGEAGRDRTHPTVPDPASSGLSTLRSIAVIDRVLSAVVRGQREAAPEA